MRTLIVLFVGGAIWGLGWEMKSSFEGTKPTKSYLEVVPQQHHHEAFADIDFNDPEAVLQAADIAFNHKSIERAAEYYGKYLSMVPSNNKVRTTYASALTLIGDTDQALVELEKVLKETPNDFTALANASITYFERGDPESGRSYGDKALKVAPTDEARVRFGAFLDKINATHSKEHPWKQEE